MSAKKKRSAPEVDQVTPELEALLGQFSDEEIESGVVARPAGSSEPRYRSDPADLQKRLSSALCEESLARLLRSARATAHFSLADVASRLSVSRGWIHQLEQEGANLQLGTLHRLADALGYDVQVSFVSREEDKPTLTAPLH